MRRWMLIIALGLMPAVGFAHSGKPLWTSQTHPYTTTMPVTDAAGVQVFTATFHATEDALLDELAPDLLSVTMPTAEEERTFDESEENAIDPEPATREGSVLVDSDASPDLIIVLEPVSGEWPKGFTLNARELLADGAIINSGHYQSYAIRKYDGVYTTAYFKHTHCSGCSDHLLYSGPFVRCTYAYDCYPGHAMSTVWTSPSRDFAIQYGESCTEARCP